MTMSTLTRAPSHPIPKDWERSMCTQWKPTSTKMGVTM